MSHNIFRNIRKEEEKLKEQEESEQKEEDSEEENNERKYKENERILDVLDDASNPFKYIEVDSPDEDLNDEELSGEDEEKHEQRGPLSTEAEDRIREVVGSSQFTLNKGPFSAEFLDAAEVQVGLPVGGQQSTAIQALADLMKEMDQVLSDIKDQPVFVQDQGIGNDRADLMIPLKKDQIISP